MGSKEYHKNYHKEWYLKNKKLRRKQLNDRKRIIREWLREYKKTLKCNRCPEDHPATMHFHHKDTSKKDLSIAQTVTWGWGKERILKEISKCEVLCANCHAKEHYERG